MESNDLDEILHRMALTGWAGGTSIPDDWLEDYAEVMERLGPLLRKCEQAGILQICKIVTD